MPPIAIFATRQLLTAPVVFDQRGLHLAGTRVTPYVHSVAYVAEMPR